MIATVKSSIFVIHELVEIPLNYMLNECICKNKKCYLLLLKILYIIIVFKIFNSMLMCQFFAAYVDFFAIFVISNR